MATLESGLNPTYSKNASVLTGIPGRVTVEVEDTIDESFWADLLSSLCPEKEFHFDPQYTVLQSDGHREKHGNGKDKILGESPSYNAWHIGCVDSDYDWLLSDYTKEGQTIKNNKYLLQTYAYSIENLMCLSCVLGDFCYAVTEENTDFDFEDYLNRFSKVVYPLLVWSLYLYSKGNRSFPASALRDVLVNTERDAEKSLKIIEDKAKVKLEELNRVFANEMAEKDSFESSISVNKDLSKDTAYLYVRGHELFDHVVSSVLNPVICSLRNSHYATLRGLDVDENIRNAALRDYKNKEKSVREILQKNYRYKNQTPIYDKIIDDVSHIWE